MDFHIISDIDIDEVKRGHMADRSMQNKYGVKYIQFRVYQEAVRIFSLFGAPDETPCDQVHPEAHGNIACSVEQAESGFYKPFFVEITSP